MVYQSDSKSKSGAAEDALDVIIRTVEEATKLAIQGKSSEEIAQLLSKKNSIQKGNQAGKLSKIDTQS